MEIIERANDCHVLMKMLCKQMQIPTKVTHIQFVETFSKLMQDSYKYQKELEERFKEGIKAGNKVLTPSDLVGQDGELTPEGEKIAEAVKAQN